MEVPTLFQSKGLTLETEVSPDLPPLFCDSTRIRQVAIDLLSNAGRFTERGGVRGVDKAAERGIMGSAIWDSRFYKCASVRSGLSLEAEYVDGAQGLPQLSHTNINQKVYKILKERILSKQFVPGQQLNVREIGAQLGVSRTPLKDALNRLAAEGLVEIRPRSGTYVTAPSLTDIEELFDVRRLLEMYAVELAVRRVGEPELAQIRDIVAQLRGLVRREDWRPIYQRHVELDYQLHRLIVCWSGNEQLRKVWEEVNVHVQISRMRYRQASSQLALAQGEHERILEAFEARDVEAARQVIGQHIERTKQLLRRDFELAG